MACFKPMPAFRTDDGDVVFVERGSVHSELLLPCGSCLGCRLSRSRAWAIRCVHEASMHDVNSFVTLTYDDEHYAPSLFYPDFQAFIRRLRKCRTSRVRFFCCGEYGDETLRPHFHALLFGCGFADQSKIGERLFRSSELERLWPFGMSSIGDVSFESAAYVARYCVKKVNGDLADEHYKRVHLLTGEIVSVQPEFGRMSLRPGIGATWFDRFWRDVYVARDGVVRGGKVTPPPRYYDKLLGLRDPALSSLKEYDRYVRSVEFARDCTPERLAVREQVLRAKFNLLERSL